MAVRTTLGENLETKSVLDGKKAVLRSAYMEPREEMQPGEMLAAALGACMLTMVGFIASKRGENVTGTELAVEPAFDEGHTRVVRMDLTFSFPASLTAEQKEFYAKAAQSCPVHNSLREDITYTTHIK
ncbi:OsmC family protein [Candidatus Avelusimicrobium alvi]|uniref:OsmC family protein n=1 Tax=Candidatus Avelusimicrobium alvi TaxID=3416221 RepID=UPI003D0995BD